MEAESDAERMFKLALTNRVTDVPATKGSPAIVDADANGSCCFPIKSMIAKELANSSTSKVKSSIAT
jgi:hypothetical protein